MDAVEAGVVVADLVNVKKDLEKSDDELFFDEIDRLHKIKKFNDDELDRLEEYCRCRIQAFRMRKLIQDEGEVFISARGGSYINPRCCLLQSVLTRMDKLRDKLFPPNTNQTAEVKDIRGAFFD